MSIYDVDYTQAGSELLPPDKRNPFMLAWVKCILIPLQWLADLWFGEYRTGSTAQEWLDTTTYQKYQRAKQNTIVYESLIDDNTDAPTVTTSWQVVQANFIGLSERILYTGQILTLTYALNKRFVTVFRQPPNISDIFISNNVVPVFPFIFGATSENSSSFFAQSSTEFFINDYSFTGEFNFSINMPTDVYNALDPTPSNCDKIVRAFVDKYIPSGITYNIVLY